jgi:hypothetical protein
MANRSRPSAARGPIRAPITVHDGASYVAGGQIVAVLELDADHRLVFLLRREPPNKGKTAQRTPRSATVRVFTIGLSGAWWPQANGWFVPLERVADVEMAMMQLRQAADRVLDAATAG